mgnify:CR=1 FL=1
MLGNVIFVYFGNIAINFMIIVGEVFTISLLCKLVPFGRENALPTDSLKTYPQPADSSEQIDKFERCVC